MTSSESNTRYPSLSEDTRDASPHDHLLPSMNKMRLPRNYSVTLNLVLILRIIASILSLTSFIILVIDGGDHFIAADIFVMCILILDLLMIVHHSVSDVFKVTVELRRQAWSGDLGSKDKPKVATYFDYGLSIGLLLCLIIGNALKSHWDGGAWQAAVVIGYLVVILQFLMALPILEKFALMIKLHEIRGKAPLDTKAPDAVDETERGSARRRTPEAEVRAASAEVLV